MNELFKWDYVFDHLDDIWLQTREHLWLTVIAVGIGFLISFPLALLSHRLRWTYTPITWISGILYTIPSLALFAFLVPYTGLSTLTAEIGLVSYTLLILIRNIVSGLDSVPDDVQESALGMGLSRSQLLWRVQLPLALPVILAGIRIATVTTVGLVTVTAVIGQGGVGAYILDGFRRLVPTFAILGASIAIVLAVVLDRLLIGLERLLTPWSKRRAGVAV
ncbi:MAG: ABC transporter permease [Actinomycetota bacterium]